MRNITMLMLLSCLVFSGCATTSEQSLYDRAYIENIREQSVRARANVVKKEKKKYVKFEDVNLMDKKILNSITNKAFLKKTVDNYVNTGQIETVRLPDGTILFPYGLRQPKLICAKNMYSKIILQEGESILNLSASDTLMWKYNVTYKGTSEKFTAIIEVRPISGGLQGNLSITTDRREYDVILNSINSGEFVPRIGFYYPQDEADKIKIPLPPINKKIKNSQTTKVNVNNVDFGYEIEGDKRLAWYPESVYDDGSKVFIKMSEDVANSELPIFFVLKGKTVEVVNYRYKEPYFIVDLLFKKGALVLIEGKKEEKVVITRKRR